MLLDAYPRVAGLVASPLISVVNAMPDRDKALCMAWIRYRWGLLPAITLPISRLRGAHTSNTEVRRA
jgi:hypothetical protein